MTFFNERGDQLLADSGIDRRFWRALAAEARYLGNVRRGGRPSDDLQEAITHFPEFTSTSAQGLFDEANFWTHPQLPAELGESEDDYIERFSEFSNVNQGREIRGLE